MTRKLCVLAMLALVGIFVAATIAQPGGGRGQGGQAGGPGGMGMRGGPGGGMMERLFEDAEIRKELGLTDEQVEKLNAIRDETRQAMQNAPRPGADGDREAFRAEMEKRFTETREKMEAVFSSEQLGKARVLAFQAAGGLNSPMLRPELLAPLKLSDEQREKVQQIFEETRKEREALMPPRGQGGGGSPEEMRARFEEMRPKMEALAAKTREQVSGVLTAEQKALAEKWTNEGEGLRERLRPQRGEGRGEGPAGEGRGQREGRRERGEGEEGYRPGRDSWQPGQGTPPDGERPRRGFPRAEGEN